MNLTTKRIELPGVGRVAVVAVGLVIGCGACASALALRVQVAAPMSARQTINAMVGSEVVQQMSPAQAQSVSPPNHATAMSVQSAPVVMPDHMIVAVPSSGEKPKASFQMELDPAQIAAAETDPATGLKVVHVGSDATNMPIPQNSKFQVSPGIMAGQIMTKTTPIYPQEAKDAKLSGQVVLKAVIGKDGAIRSLQLVSGPDLLAKSAWTAVKDWTYKPYLLNGNPVEVETTITVNYSLAQ